MPNVSVTYNDRHDELPFEDVFTPERRQRANIPEGIEITAATVNEVQVKAALADYYDVARTEFQDHFFAAHPNGNVTVRPNTKFGW